MMTAVLAVVYDPEPLMVAVMFVLAFTPVEFERNVAVQVMVVGETTVKLFGALMSEPAVPLELFQETEDRAPIRSPP